MVTQESLKVHVGGMVETNGYLLTLGKETFVIDAPKGMFEFVSKEGVTPTAMLLTHQHYDHIEDASYFSEQGVPIYAYETYSSSLTLEDSAARWGAAVSVAPFLVSHELKAETQITIGEHKISILHVPGHSPDSVVFHFTEKQALFAGDTLFCGSIGRTDLPGGSHQDLLNGIREKMLCLNDDTQVFSGHGQASSIGKEKASNPFIR